MGIRFSRRLRSHPGVLLSTTGTGVSTSFGTHGAWLTVGKHGSHTTLGIRRTGARYARSGRSRVGLMGWIMAAVFGWFVYRIIRAI